MVLWRQGRCLPYGEGIAYWPIGEAVKAQAGILESDDLAATASKLAIAVEGMPDPDWLRARLAPLLGLETGSGSRDESFAAWRTFFEELAAGSPLVLIIEDLHWADQAMLEFVEYLVEWSAGEPILVIGTARPELFERHPGWGGGKRNATTLSLSSLSDEDTARLVAALLERSVLPAETQALLLERAGGNPLFAEEFVRMLRDRGVTDAVVPGNVQALIAARLDTLDPGRKRLIHNAAVVGKVFWGGAVAAIGGVDPAHVRGELHELVRKELIKPARLSSVEGEQEYVFWHALVRDVAYGQIPRADRIACHVAAAEWIERVTGDRAGDHAEILAHHYLSAAELADATGGVDPAPLRSRGVDQLLLAGMHTRNVDSARTLQLLARAAELQDADDARLPTTLAWAARTANEHGDFEQSRALIDEAYERALDQGDELAIGLTQAWRAGFLGSARREEIERALTLVERHPPGWQLSSVLTGLAAIHMLEERPRDSLAVSERALPIAERYGTAGDLPLLLEARAWSRSDTGDAGGIDDGRRALQICLDTHGAHAPTSALNLAGLLWIWEGPSAAVEMYEFAAREADRRRQTPVYAHRELAWVLLELGAWDDALATAQKCVVWAREHSEPEALAMAAAAAAVVSARRGQAGAAVAAVEEALETIRESPEPQIRQPGLISAAEARLAAGEAAAARRHLDELLGGRFGGTFMGLHLPSAVATAIATDATETATRLIDAASAFSPRLAAGADLSTGLLLEAEGDPRAALELLRRSADAFRGLQMPYERARALESGVRCLTALGRPTDAEPLASESADLLQGLGCATRAPASRPADSVGGV
jgi:tetratricopeptide (TPR) repeat protein